MLLVIDNRSYGSTANQPTYIREPTFLPVMVRGGGCQNVIECSREETLGVLGEAISADHCSVIISKDAAENEAMRIAPIHPIVL
jgi:sulfopyruvate decarboxylase subunit beta